MSSWASGGFYEEVNAAALPDPGAWSRCHGVTAGRERQTIHLLTVFPKLDGLCHPQHMQSQGLGALQWEGRGDALHCQPTVLRAAPGEGSLEPTFLALRTNTSVYLSIHRCHLPPHALKTGVRSLEGLSVSVFP